MLNEQKLGNSDRPVSSCLDDEFQIKPYIEGLAEFIKDCETPMTVAVQGDWGCGKTSMMNMVRNHLNPEGKDDEIVDVWFNTWQFSQFNMDDTLAVTFLQHLLNELIKNIAHDKEVKDNLVPKMKRVLKTLAVNVTSLALGEHAANLVGAVGDELASDETELDAAAKIMELKSTFHEIINKVNKRVVVYIDDLDRLQPVRAVELLEVLKLFVDCENCVFVMAIDTSVVFQGIREKYGNDMSQAKAQSFFDKMIQLPFKMPVAYYKLDGMIQRLLTFMQDNSIITSENERKDFISLLKNTAGGNPRSLKRLVNSIMLIDKVAVKKCLYSAEATPDKSLKVQILVALSCLQHRFNEVYDFIVGNITPRTVNQLRKIEIPDKTRTDRCEKLLEKLYELGMPHYSDDGIDDTAAFYILVSFFILKLKKYFDNGHNAGEKDDHLNWGLVQIISLNNITDPTMDHSDVEHAHTPTIFDGMLKQAEELVKQEIGNDNVSDTQDIVAASSEVNTSDNTDVEAFAAEIRAMHEDRSQKLEAYRRLLDAGIYTSTNDIDDDEYNTRTKPYMMLDKKLRDWFRTDEQEIARGLYYSTYKLPDHNNFELAVNIIQFRMTVFKIKFGYGKMLHTMPIAKRIHSFVDWLKAHHQELRQLYGDKIMGEDPFCGTAEGYDDEGNKYYNRIDMCELKIIVFSDKVIDEIIQLALEIANDPSLVQAKD